MSERRKEWSTEKDTYMCSNFLFWISVHSPSAHSVNSSQPNGTNMLSRNRTSSTTNPNAITSPFSPLNNNSNHIDQNSQSMSPKLSGEHQSMLNSTPLTTNDLFAFVRIHSKDNEDFRMLKWFRIPNENLTQTTTQQTNVQVALLDHWNVLNMRIIFLRM